MSVQGLTDCNVVAYLTSKSRDLNGRETQSGRLDRSCYVRPAMTCTTVRYRDLHIIGVECRGTVYNTCMGHLKT